MRCRRGSTAIDGPDRTGTVYAVVDARGRPVDVGLDPGWWTALGPDGIGDALLEAIEFARSKVDLATMMRRRHGFGEEEPEPDGGFVERHRYRGWTSPSSWVRCGRGSRTRTRSSTTPSGRCGRAPPSASSPGRAAWSGCTSGQPDRP